MSVRVELLPQSIAATALATDVVDHERTNVERARDDFAHGIVRSDEEVREVGVQALDAHAGTTHTAGGLDEIRANRRRAPTSRVLVVRALEGLGVNESFEAVHTPFALDATDRVVQFGVDEPEERGHRCAVTKVGFVLDDDGSSVRVAHDDREAPRERPSYQCLDERVVVG